MTDTTVTNEAPSSASPLQTDTQRPDPAPAARGAITDGAYDGLPPEQQSKYARVKNGDQGGQWVARDQLAPDRGQDGQPSATTDRVKIGDVEVSQAELQEMLVSRAEALARKATLPAAASEYDPTLPPGFEMPPGTDFKIDTNSPLLESARNWAFGKGLSQGDFSELVGLFAHSQGLDAATLNTAKQAEIAKLGANGPMRVTALSTFFDGIGAPEMKQMLVTAGIVKAAEKLHQRFVNQGAATFSQSHREPPDHRNGRVSEAEYSAMTPAQRLDYTRQFDQKSFGPNQYDTSGR